MFEEGTVIWTKKAKRRMKCTNYKGCGQTHPTEGVVREGRAATICSNCQHEIGRQQIWRKVYKWPMKDTMFQTLHLPKGAKILSIQKQGDGFMLWAEITYPLFEDEERWIARIGTGYDEIPDTAEYITTIQIPSYILPFSRKNAPKRTYAKTRGE